MTSNRSRRGCALPSLLVMALLAAAAGLLHRCGDFDLDLGFIQLGGGGASDPAPRDPTPREPATPSADAAAPEAAPPPCQLRLDATGLTLEGAPVSLERAVDACRPAGKADLRVTGDANYGELQRIRAALEAEGITVLSP